MRIIDPYYFITTLTIAIGFGILIYMKFALVAPQYFQVTILGSKVDSILLAYQLAKLSQPLLNITLIGKFDEQLLSYADSTIENDKLNMASLYSPYIERKILNFCGTQPLLMQLLEDSLLQYKIKRSQTLFNKGTTAKLSEEQLIGQTYSLDKEGNFLNSMFDYGLSHLTAKSIFTKFQLHLEREIDYQPSNIKSIRNILDEIMPDPQKPFPNGVSYMSQFIGLDQQYIRDYLGPLISSTYFHNVNSVAAIFKVLPLYCYNFQSKVRTKNLALLLDEKVLAAKLLIKLHEYKNIHLKSEENISIEEQGAHFTIKILKNNITEELQSNLVVTLEDFIEQNQKQISYYRAIVDGVIPHDDQYEQVYTVHFQTPPILSVTRLCAVDCKNFKHNVYLVLSKSKITERDLTIFVQHQIIAQKKMWAARSQLPSYTIKMEERENFLRIPDTEIISDNYEMKLIIFKSVAHLIKKKMSQNCSD